jgi:hypothetical protein
MSPASLRTGPACISSSICHHRLGAHGLAAKQRAPAGIIQQVVGCAVGVDRPAVQGGLGACHIRVGRTENLVHKLALEGHAPIRRFDDENRRGNLQQHRPQPRLERVLCRPGLVAGVHVVGNVHRGDEHSLLERWCAERGQRGVGHIPPQGGVAALVGNRLRLRVRFRGQQVRIDEREGRCRRAANQIAVGAQHRAMRGRVGVDDAEIRRGGDQHGRGRVIGDLAEPRGG